MVETTTEPHQLQRVECFFCLCVCVFLWVSNDSDFDEHEGKVPSHPRRSLMGGSCKTIFLGVAWWVPRKTCGYASSSQRKLVEIPRKRIDPGRVGGWEAPFPDLMHFGKTELVVYKKFGLFPAHEVSLMGSNHPNHLSVASSGVEKRPPPPSPPCTKPAFLEHRPRDSGMRTLADMGIPDNCL